MHSQARQLNTHDLRKDGKESFLHRQAAWSDAKLHLCLSVNLFVILMDNGHPLVCDIIMESPIWGTAIALGDNVSVTKGKIHVSAVSSEYFNQSDTLSGKLWGYESSGMDTLYFWMQNQHS